MREIKSYQQKLDYYAQNQDKYGQYDWFNEGQANSQKNYDNSKALHNVDTSGHMNTNTKDHSRNQTINPEWQHAKDIADSRMGKGGISGTGLNAEEYAEKYPENKNTNQYGDPEGTNYAGGSPTFNERTGQQESYTGANGAVTNGNKDNSWAALEQEDAMRVEMKNQAKEAGGRYNFMQQQSGLSEMDYWNAPEPVTFDKTKWAEKTYGGQFS